MRKIWMLKVEDGGNPSAVHSNYESALKRAEDLARGTGKPVGILELTQVVVPIMPEIQNINLRLEDPVIE